MSASLLLSLLLGSVIGLLAHSILGRRLWQLPCFWAAGIGGFLAGEIFAVLVGMEFLRLGSIPLPGALGGAALATFVCWFVTTLPSALQSSAAQRAKARQASRTDRRPARLATAEAPAEPQ